jgi:hypothetical protein
VAAYSKSSINGGIIWNRLKWEIDKFIEL